MPTKNIIQDLRDSEYGRALLQHWRTSDQELIKTERPLGKYDMEVAQQLQNKLGSYENMDPEVLNRKFSEPFKWEDLLGQQKDIKNLPPETFDGGLRQLPYRLPHKYIEGPNWFAPTIMRNVFGSVIKGSWTEFLFYEGDADLGNSEGWKQQYVKVVAPSVTEGGLNNTDARIGYIQAETMEGSHTYGHSCIMIPYDWAEKNGKTRLEAEIIVMQMMKAHAERKKEFVYEIIFRTMYRMHPTTYDVLYAMVRPLFNTMREYFEWQSKTKAVLNEFEGKLPLANYITRLCEAVREYNTTWMAETEVNAARERKIPDWANLMSIDIHKIELYWNRENYTHSMVGDKTTGFYNQELSVVKSSIILRDMSNYIVEEYRNEYNKKIAPCKAKVFDIIKMLVPQPTGEDMHVQIYDGGTRKKEDFSFADLVSRALNNDAVIRNHNPEWVDIPKHLAYYQKLQTALDVVKTKGKLDALFDEVQKLRYFATQNKNYIANERNWLDAFNIGTPNPDPSRPALFNIMVKYGLPIPYRLAIIGGIVSDTWVIISAKKREFQWSKGIDMAWVERDDTRKKVVLREEFPINVKTGHPENLFLELNAGYIQQIVPIATQKFVQMTTNFGDKNPPNLMVFWIPDGIAERFDQDFVPPIGNYARERFAVIVRNADGLNEMTWFDESAADYSELSFCRPISHVLNGFYDQKGRNRKNEIVNATIYKNTSPHCYRCEFMTRGDLWVTYVDKLQNRTPQEHVSKQYGHLRFVLKNE